MSDGSGSDGPPPALSPPPEGTGATDDAVELVLVADEAVGPGDGAVGSGSFPATTGPSPPISSTAPPMTSATSTTAAATRAAVSPDDDRPADEATEPGANGLATLAPQTPQNRAPSA